MGMKYMLRTIAIISLEWKHILHTSSSALVRFQCILYENLSQFVCVSNLHLEYKTSNLFMRLFSPSSEDEEHPSKHTHTKHTHKHHDSENSDDSRGLAIAPELMAILPIGRFYLRLIIKTIKCDILYLKNWDVLLSFVIIIWHKFWLLSAETVLESEEGKEREKGEKGEEIEENQQEIIR